MNAARWTVPHDHPAFAGHFPGRPIVPGVVLLDRAVQAVEQASGRRAVGVGSVKFLSAVGPGATLEFSWAATAAGALRIDIASGGAAVATGTLTMAEQP